MAHGLDHRLELFLLRFTLGIDLLLSQVDLALVDATDGLLFEGRQTLQDELVDRIADFLESLPDRPVSRDETPTEIRRLLPDGGPPREGTDPSELLETTSAALFDHSVFNGHPRFFGYITASAAPVGALDERFIGYLAGDQVVEMEFDVPIETARIAFPAVEVRTDARLREMSYGVLNGCPEETFPPDRWSIEVRCMVLYD